MEVKYQGDYKPEYATKGAAGFDLKSRVGLWLHPRKTVIVPTGLHVELPDGYELQIRARSGFSVKHDVIVKNGVGTIDADYRGEIGVILYNMGKRSVYINKGDRIAQGVLCKVTRAKFKQETLAESQRGASGYGSTGTR